MNPLLGIALVGAGIAGWMHLQENMPDAFWREGRAKRMSPEDFDQAQLKKGIKIEMEHTTDWRIARKIAMDHLAEFPSYYIELERMEKKLER
jgi:hypothetical protein